MKRKVAFAILLIALGFNLQAQEMGKSNRVEIETKPLDELYKDALEEGGEFVLRAGGDKPDQIDYYLDKFKKRFPK
ncbi:MAG: hypothetical protein AAFY00_06960, partial [Bacteroidota bacterium]